MLEIVIMLALSTPAAAPPAKVPPAARFAAKGACDSTTTKGACVEYPTFGARTEADEKKVCELGFGTTWVSGQGCPTTTLLGSCTQKGTGQIQRWYDLGPNKGQSTATMKDACAAMMGVFTAP